jgi:ABC-type uncharacterized transport system fused permease/ATPase subunit
VLIIKRSNEIAYYRGEKMAKNVVNVSINDVYASIDDEISRMLTKKIVDLFVEHYLCKK